MELHKAGIPMLGAAYYPEGWDDAEQDKDIARMKKAGLTVVRIAEFAWSKMERKEGVFDFTWLRQVMDKLYAAGICVVLGTPTATPPVWSWKKVPDIFRINENRLPELHGGRRNCCSNHPYYREISARIVEKMAQEFGHHPALIGWQLDNEIGVKEQGCFCENCRKGFHEYLKQKYGTIEELNRRWNLCIFSQEYDEFEDVPMPERSWRSPHHRLDWFEFQSGSHLEFLRMQADILHRYSDAPVGTDMMPTFQLDYEQVAEFSDVMQFNHYARDGILWMAEFWFDYLRTLRDRPFWNTETSTCYPGSIAVGGDLRPDGFCRANSWMPVALGGEATMYWLFRQHWAGHELMHGSVYYANGEPTHPFEEVKEVAAGFEKAKDFLAGTRVVSDTALQVSAHNANLLAYQPVYRVPNSPMAFGQDHNYKYRVYDLYHSLLRCGVRPDVVAVQQELERYKLLVSPAMLTLEMGDLQKRITDWVMQGGVWLVGPLTDLRNDIGAHFTDGRSTSILEKLTGAKIAYQVPDEKHRLSLQWNADGSPLTANQWVECFRIPADAQPLATVTDGFESLKGTCVAFQKQVGKGWIIVCGTFPDAEDWDRIVRLALKKSGAACLPLTGELIAAPRAGEAGNGLVLTEIGGKEATCALPAPMTDLLTGKRVEGTVSLSPYEVMVLKAD